MPLYHCGYCKCEVINDIWCNQTCRMNWYAERRVSHLATVADERTQAGPHGRAEGGKAGRRKYERRKS